MLSENMIWMLLCGVLIFFMQAGFAMLETGFTRAKNAGNIVMKNIMDICIGAPLFAVIGFGLMYGRGNGLIGKLDLRLAGDYSGFLPEGTTSMGFLFFMLTFCATAATIVSGAMAERTRFAAYCIYSAVISAVIFPVIGHWIWGGGWLSQMGFHDFAGGTLVHTTGGVTACIGAWLLGPRRGKYGRDGKVRAIEGHNITLSALGVLILWFGWYGFNGGSVLTSGAVPDHAGTIFLNTTLAACLSAVTAMLASRIKYKKADVSMTINGVLAGLVAVTAGCDKLDPLGAAITGAAAGAVLVGAVEWIDRKLRIDDPVGAIAAHGVSGILGTVLTGLLATDQGLFYTGKTEFLGTQICGSAAVILFAAASMFVVFKLIDLTVGLRVEPEAETEGLDRHEHGLCSAYGDFLLNGYLEETEMEETAVPLAVSAVQPEPAGMSSVSAVQPEPAGMSSVSAVQPEPAGMSSVSAVQPEPAGMPSVSLNQAVPVEKVAAAGLAKVEIIMKQSRFEVLKHAMNQIGITGMTVTQVLGCGIQKGMAEYYRGAPVDIQLLPKIKVEIVVAEVPAETVVAAARRVLYTGHIGDGKIFIYDVRDAVKIRTGAAGYEAMQGLQD